MKLKILTVCTLSIFLNSIIPASAGWALRWSDEFNGNSVDTLKWNIEDWASSRNNELQFYAPSDVYMEPTRSPSGWLTLRSQKRSYGGRSYTSGAINTKNKFSFTYGRIDVRAKLPIGQGIWPAAWLLPQDGTWPPELDIMENLGHDPNLVYSTRWYGTSPNQMHDTGTFSGTSFNAAFHTFTMLWEPTQIRFYIDPPTNIDSATPFFRVTTNIPTKAMYILLNTAVGGDWPGSPDATTVFPQYYNIDWVRVYYWQ